MTPEHEASDVHARLREVLEEIEKRGHELIPKQNVGLSDEQVLIWALLTHTVRMFRAIRVLLQEGLAHEANVLNRALLEAVTLLSHIMVNADNIEEMRLRLLSDSLRELESLAQFEQELNMPDAPEAIAETHRQRQALNQAFAQKGLSPGGLPNVRQMLKRLGKEERYWYFKRASADVHGGVAALGAKMTEQSEGHFMASLQDGDKTALAIGMVAADHLMSALIAASAILEWPNNDDVRSYRERGDAFLMNLGRDAGLRGIPPEESL